MKIFKRDLIITAILFIITVAFGAIAQNFEIDSTWYDTFSVFAIVGCIVLFVMIIKLILDIIIVRGKDDGY